MAETEDKPLTEAEVVRVQPGPGPAAAAAAPSTSLRAAFNAEGVPGGGV